MKKRSKYRPKGVNPDPIGHMLTGAKSLVEYNSYLIDVKIKNHGAMHALLYGTATQQDMDTLITMVNMCEALYRMGVGADYADVVDTGLEALYQVGSRGREGNKFVCKLPEVAALNDLMELHNAQMDTITVRDIEKALSLVHQEYRLKKTRRLGETK